MAQAVKSNAENFDICMADGEIYAAKQVFDSRFNPADRLTHAGLYQHFLENSFEQTRQYLMPRWQP